MSFSVDWTSWPVAVVLAGCAARFAWGRFLSFLDYRELRRKSGKEGYEEAAAMHPEFRELVSEKKFGMTAEYARAYAPLSAWSSAYGEALGLAVLASCAYPRLFAALTWDIPCAVPVAIALGAFAVGFAVDVLSAPFDLYATFSVEERFGFNKQTPTGWLADFAKEHAVDLAVTAVEAFAAYYALSFAAKAVDLTSPWFAAGAALGVAAYGMAWESVWISWIAPLFNKFKPLEDAELAGAIRESLASAGYGLDGVYVMDASRRSTHGNAYFCGWGRSRRIVIYDVLLEKHSRKEVMAVINHEIGHLAHGDITKGRVVSAVWCAAVTFAAARLVTDPSLYAAFGFSSVTAANVGDWYVVGFALAGTVIGSVSWLLTPAFSWLSRRDEFAADRFAAERGTGDALATGLIRMYANDLSGFFDHWLAEAWFADHPGLRRRVEAIRAAL